MGLIMLKVPKAYPAYREVAFISDTDLQKTKSRVGREIRL